MIGSTCHILTETKSCLLDLEKCMQVTKANLKELENEQKQDNDNVDYKSVDQKSSDNINDEMKSAIIREDSYGGNYKNDNKTLLETISFDLKELTNKVTEISQYKTNNNNTNIISNEQYFTQLHQISARQRELCQNISKIHKKCETKQTETASRILEIDEKKHLTQNMDQTDQIILECENKLNMCKRIAKKHLELIESHEFELTLDNFEKEWSKWDDENILVWFKTILAKNSTKIVNINTINDNEDEKNTNIVMDGQVAPTPGGTDMAEDDDKKMSNINNDSDNVDWSLLSLNLKRRDWDGDHLLICNEKQLIKLGFNNDANVRKHLLFNIKRIAKKYPPKTSPGKGANDNGICCICLSNKSNTICIPCGHACMCKKCSNDYDKNDVCPICRKPFKIFLTCLFLNLFS